MSVHSVKHHLRIKNRPALRGTKCGKTLWQLMFTEWANMGKIEEICVRDMLQ
jgi:hypothetical protein